MNSEKMQYRKSEEFNISESDEMVVEGYAIIFNSPTVLFTDQHGREFKEVVLKSAFDNTPLNNVLLRYNHNDNVPILARSKNGTLQLEVDDKGLKIRAVLADTQQGRDIYQLIKRGDLSALSIGFIVGRTKYEGNTCIIEEIKQLIEISIVDNPAYHDTSIYALRDELKASQDKQLQYLKNIVLLKTY